MACYHIYAILLVLFSLSISHGAFSIETGTCGEKLGINRAQVSLDVGTLIDYPLGVYATNSECYKCSRYLVLDTTMLDSCAFLYTPFSWKLELMNGSTVVDSQDYVFGEHGHYQLEVNRLDIDTMSLSVTEIRSPLDSMLPVYGWLGFFLALVIVCFAIPPYLSDIKKFLIDNFFSQSFTRPSPYVHVSNQDDQESNSMTASLLSNDSSGKTASHSTHSSTTEGSFPSSNAKKAATPTSASQRVNSLDTFRGMALAMMIFVNYGGGGYWFFDHAAWNGLTIADLLFPAFIWIMGVSMSITYSRPMVRKIVPSTLYFSPEEASSFCSFTSQSLMREALYRVGHVAWVFIFGNDDDKELSHQESSNSSTHKDAHWQLITSCRQHYLALYYHAIVRSFQLFAIGMFLANGWEIKTWRIPGVLQYFGVTYFLVSMTILYFLPYTNKALQEYDLSMTQNPDAMMPQQSGNWLQWLSWSRWKPYQWEFLFQAMLLLLYLIITLGVPAPGCPRGYNGPGGLSENGQYWDCTGGIHRYVDMKMFGYWLIFHHPTCLEIYDCVPYDPEGLLGVLSATTLTYLGLTCGRVLQHTPDWKQRVKEWVSMGLFLLFVAGVLCGFSQNEGWIPINKNLWSTSFVVFNAGSSLIGLTVSYLLVDVWKVWSGAPFRFLGMNSILIYVGHSLFWAYFPFGYKTDLHDHNHYLQMSVIGTCCWIMVAYYCYSIKFFVKI